MISHVKHVTIPVKDQNKALKFYTEKLGFEVAVDVDFGEQRWIELKIPGGETMIVLHTPEGHEDRIGTFSPVIFSSKDIKKTYEDLKKRDVEFTQELTEEPWGTFAIFADPDGNRFCLSST